MDELQQTAYKRLRRETPVMRPSSNVLGLCDPRLLLTPEHYAARQEALAKLALASQVAIPDDIMIA